MGKDKCVVNGQEVEILDAGESTMYLGRSLNLVNTQDIELENRMSAAWRKFMSRKSELCNKNYSIRDRLRLFEATISKTVLYGSEAWAPTAAVRSRLATTQQKMQRWMIGTQRRVDMRGDIDSSSENSEPVPEDDHKDESSEWGEDRSLGRLDQESYVTG